MNVRLIIYLMLGVFVVGGAPALATDTAQKTGTPNAVLTHTSYNFPTVVDGVTIVHEFPIKNLGTATLQIHKIKTG